jgi:lipopolysaccharide transport system permease protein
MIVPLLKYRGLIWQHALSELRYRYAGTGLGVVWNVLHPLALIAVYTLVFSTIYSTAPNLSLPAERFGFLMYLCSGLLPWLAFAECITRGTGAFVDNAAYLKKLPIPEPVFVAQAAASATMGLAISFSILILLALAVKVHPSIWWLLLPLPLLALQALGFSIGLLCGTLNVFFRDIGQILAVALQVAMWTAPVVYIAPDRLQWLFRWHPVMPALSAIRGARRRCRRSAPGFRCSRGPRWCC